jgi:hypothetical protein
MIPKNLFDFSYVDVEENKDNVLDSLGFIQREGIDDLMEYLEKSDFFTAPASTRYHNAFAGGLAHHSLNVTREFTIQNAKFRKPLPQDSVIISGVFHDLCKIDTYIETPRGYEKRKGVPRGHGKVSVARIEEYIELTPAENDLVLFHMGTFGIFEYRDYDTLKLHKAIIRTPQVQVLAAIDMMDSKRKVEELYSRRV